MGVVLSEALKILDSSGAEGLDDILARAMARLPRRFDTAAAMSRALEEWLDANSLAVASADIVGFMETLSPVCRALS